MHYDHAGNIDLFPNARFHIQDREMAYVTGRCMCHSHIRDMLEGHKTLRKLAAAGADVVPGHDPLVMQRYPVPRPELAGIAVRLDAEPTEGRRSS